MDTPTTGTLRLISEFTSTKVNNLHDGQGNCHCGYLRRLCAARVAIVGAFCTGASYEDAGGPLENVHSLACAAWRANVVVASHMVVHMLVKMVRVWHGSGTDVSN